MFQEILHKFAFFDYDYCDDDNDEDDLNTAEI
jgi:hypothetical protein